MKGLIIERSTITVFIVGTCYGGDQSNWDGTYDQELLDETHDAEILKAVQDSMREYYKRHAKYANRYKKRHFISQQVLEIVCCV